MCFEFLHHYVSVWYRVTAAILDSSPKETPDNKMVVRKGFIA